MRTFPKNASRDKYTCGLETNEFKLTKQNKLTCPIHPNQFHDWAGLLHVLRVNGANKDKMEADTINYINLASKDGWYQALEIL